MPTFRRDHPDTLTTRNIVGVTLLEKGRAADAEAVFRQVLDHTKENAWQGSSTHAVKSEQVDISIEGEE